MSATLARLDRGARCALALLLGAAFAALVAASSALAAQPELGLDPNAATGAGGNAKSPNAPAYSVDGFRSAHFGMSEEEVRGAIRTDFKIPDGRILKETNPTERTNAFTITVPNLLPGAGPARLTYIFGYRSKRLIHVNAIWTGPKPPEGQQNDLLGAALALRNYFLSFSFEREGLVHDAQLADGAVLLFQGSDREGRTVQLIAGTARERRDNKKPESEQVIRLSYIENLKSPDIYRIPPGSF